MSRELDIVINTAIRKANALKHEYLTLESVLLCLLNDNDVVSILVQLGVNIESLREELEGFLDQTENFSILSDDQIKELGQAQFANDEVRKIAEQSGIFYQPELSLGLQRVIQRSAIQVQSAGKKTIKAVNLLISILDEEHSFAVFCLKKRGVKKIDLMRHLSHGQFNQNGEFEAGPDVQEGDSKDGQLKRYRFLKEYAENLVFKARNHKIDPLVGREKEISRICQVLCRRRKNNPLLVGEAGVGKTAIAEGLAYLINEQKVPEVLKNTEVYSLDIASLLAGAKFRGDFEQRFKGVLKDLTEISERLDNPPVLFIDEIHTLMGAGATSGSPMDASNLLKPFLISGQVRILGSTTFEEYRKFVEKDKAFSRRFQKVDVDEPSKEDTIKILKGLKAHYEDYHQLKISDEMLDDIVNLTQRYLSDRKNPDKSIDVIDETLAKRRVENGENKELTLADFEKTVSSLANLPEISVASDEKERLKALKSNLQKLIYGQDEAIDQCVDAILMARSGLQRDNKPIASFLFAGPTGVGKTEIARQLSFHLGNELIRFDMSEYMEKHTVSKLIGAPPGYIGHDDGGALTDAVKKHPHCVLLLDEIEKAHVDIFNILLQIMDNGVLTDSQGRKTDFKNAIIIMTTNAGASEMDSGSIGLGSSLGMINTHKRDAAIKRFFTPEFRNRLDGIIHFNKLTEDLMVKVVEKFLLILENRLLEKNIELQVSMKAKKWLASQGFDPKMGARPLERFIEKNVAKPISKELLFGKLSKGGRVQVELLKKGQKEEIDLQFLA